MNDKILLEEFEKKLSENGISRRDAIKLLGASSALMFTSQEAKATENKIDTKLDIVIVGGGLAGISTASRLRNTFENATITVIEPNPDSVTYQPGNTFIGAGLYEKKDVMYKLKDFMPKGVELIAEKAMEFNPENNSLVTSSGKKVDYDVLVVSAGLVLDFEKIKGLEELGNLYTVQNNKKIEELFLYSGASTIYNVDAAVVTWKNMQKVMKDAQSGKKQKAVFTHPDSAVKCGGAPKKIMYLMNSRLNEAGVRDNVDMIFYPNGGKLFAVKEYEEAIKNQFEARNMKWKFKHNLTAVDLQNKVATFDYRWDEKGEYDEDLEEYSVVTKHRNVEVPYNFLHITPPMKAAPEIAQSAIGSVRGWVPVHKETLQHVKYKNVFSLGDIAAVPLGKTGGSVRKQYKVLVDNIVNLVNQKELSAKYDGYTVCPIITDIGKVMLAEFDYTLRPRPSFPLDPTQERYIWWLLKAYILKPMTQYGMLSGRA